MSNAPQIRFKGFTDAWEQRKLGEVAERVTRKNTNLESTLPLTISAQFGLIDQNEFFDRQIASKDVSGYFLLRKGEFAYSKSYSNGYPWGAVKRLDRYEKGVLSTLYIVFLPTDVESEFLLQYYETSRWHDEVAIRAAEGARNHGLLNITPSDFFNTALVLPVEIDEQTAIGNFFRTLDSTITLHQRKLDGLRELKKGYLQQMFPQADERVPRVRFSGFRGEWQERRLGELFTERSERGAEGELISVTINSGVVKANSLERKDNSSEDKSNYKKVYAGDIAYNSMRMWQGASGISNYSGILSPAYTVIIPNHNANAMFFSYVFKLSPMIQKFQASSQGLTSDTWNLKFPLLSKILVVTPCYQEQTAIGKFFLTIDNQITALFANVERLKELKKAYLQKMFI